MKDDNDRLLDGSLPEDPFTEGTVVADEVPRILTVRDLLVGAGTRSRQKHRHTYGTTGHHQLDSVTGGLRPGDCWLVGADTSWGKSSFAVMLVDENLKRGKQVLLVSSEDSEQTYGDRLLCRRSGVPAQALRDRRLRAEHHEAIAQVVAEARPDPVFIDARGKTVEWLAPQVKRAVKEYNIDVVIFDYIGAFTCKMGQQDRRNAVTYVARCLTDIAKTAKPGGLCGILLSQLTISDENTAPGKYAYRDSKDLIQMAEIGLLGYAAPKAIPEHGIEQGDKLIRVVKCKQGAAGGTIQMHWDSTVACFRTVVDEETKRLESISDGFEWDQLGE